MFALLMIISPYIYICVCVCIYMCVNIISQGFSLIVLTELISRLGFHQVSQCRAISDSSCVKQDSFRDFRILSVHMLVCWKE